MTVKSVQVPCPAVSAAFVTTSARAGVTAMLSSATESHFCRGFKPASEAGVGVETKRDTTKMPAPNRMAPTTKVNNGLTHQGR